MNSKRRKFRKILCAVFCYALTFTVLAPNLVRNALAEQRISPASSYELDCGKHSPDAVKKSQSIAFEKNGLKVLFRDADDQNRDPIYTVVDRSLCRLKITATDMRISNLEEIVDPLPQQGSSAVYFPSALERIARMVWGVASRQCAAKPLVFYSGSRNEREERCRASTAVRLLHGGSFLTFHQGSVAPGSMVQIIVYEGKIEGIGVILGRANGPSVIDSQIDFGAQ